MSGAPAIPRSGNPNADPKSIAEAKWFDLFQDDALKQLVTTALEQNFDLKIAAEHVLEARAQAGITRSQQIPTIDATGGFQFEPRIPHRCESLCSRRPEPGHQLHAGGIFARLGGSISGAAFAA